MLDHAPLQPVVTSSLEANGSPEEGADVDVLIVGAGLSGIGAAAHLRMEHPGKSFALIEAREAIGGTWDLFRYPGIRSDSDMFTLGYRFKPWDAAEAIADGPAILEYVRETAREYDIERRIRFNRRAVRAEWSSAEALWRVALERTDQDESEQVTCRFLHICSGYYRYDEGYTPPIEGLESFEGTVIHPQHWPEDFGPAGKRIVVIGSGATAMTLVPALAGKAGHVTMLQRSPTYVISMPGTDPIAEVLRRFLPTRAAYAALRWKNVLLQLGFYRLARRAPRFVRRVLRWAAIRLAPPGYDVDTHFNPRYDPWDQRVCLVPDSDLFEALGKGGAEIVTGRIGTVTATGIELESGELLEADTIVTATGLNLLAFGGVELVVDGEPVELPQAVGYKGMMLCGVPNLAMTLGYANASWTLKADLVCEYVCRLLERLDEGGFDFCVPSPPDPSEPLEPFIDLQAGYVLRSIDQLPKQGIRWPWRLHQNYVRDVLRIRHGSIDDEAMEWRKAPETGVRDRPAATASAPR